MYPTRSYYPKKLKFPFEGLVARLTQPRKENTFWEDHHTTKSKLKGEDDIKRGIEDVLDELGVREGEYQVNAVYLYGSVAALRGKTHYHKDPQDVDLFVWVYNSRKDITLSIQDKFSEILGEHFTLPVNCTFSVYGVNDFYDMTGHLRFLGVDPMHTLYESIEKKSQLE